MAIEFLCPNRHRIRCSEDRAGKPAKCPKCGVKFLVPELSEIQAAGSGKLKEQANPPSKAAPSEPQIEFLCPNGHRLHGPASLQGRPGQCPECGSRFRVPSYDEVPGEEEMEAEQQLSLSPGGQAEETLTQEEQYDGDSAAELEEADTAMALSDSNLAQASGEAESFGALFARLWKEKARGASIELFLTEGRTIHPDRFAAGLSRGRHGLFAVKESDGSYTLTAIAWDAVARVVVRNVRQLPEELRD